MKRAQQAAPLHQAPVLPLGCSGSLLFLLIANCWPLIAAFQLLPYTGIAAPVIARAASEHRNRNTRAICSGDTHLLKSAFGRSARFSGVSIVPGSTQLTVIPRSEERPVGNDSRQ